MLNKTGALMMQTIMFLMEKENSTGVTQYSNTAESSEVERCFPPYGCFSITYPWLTDTRPVNNFPADPKQLNVKFPVFTRRNMRLPLILTPEDREGVRASNIDPQGPFYFISHGYTESGDKPWIEQMSRALLSQEGHSTATVIVVDWRQGSFPPYSQAVANIRLVGVLTAHFIHMLYEELGLQHLDNFHYIGHSLGAHLGGYCGHTLQKRFGLKLGRITGLDPAEPHFANTAALVRLDRDDAGYVDIVHSDATPIYSGGFGISERIGHVDFFPNGGNSQPGCDQSMFSYIQSQQGSVVRGVHSYLSCNHVRSYQFFTESIAPTCPFNAIQCSSYEAFLLGNCSRCDADHVCLPLGLHSRPVYRRLLAADLVRATASVQLFSMTGDGANGTPFCKVHYKVSFKVSDGARSAAEGEAGQLRVRFVDVAGAQTEYANLDSTGSYHAPGSLATVMVAADGTGRAPASVVVEWRRETNPLNPFTWRMSQPKIYLDWLKVTSMEYKAEITVCPEPDKPILANVPHRFNITNCANAA